MIERNEKIGYLELEGGKRIGVFCQTMGGPIILIENTLIPPPDRIVITNTADKDFPLGTKEYSIQEIRGMLLLKGISWCHWQIVSQVKGWEIKLFSGETATETKALSLSGESPSCDYDKIPTPKLSPLC